MSSGYVYTFRQSVSEGGEGMESVKITKTNSVDKWEIRPEEKKKLSTLEKNPKQQALPNPLRKENIPEWNIKAFWKLIRIRTKNWFYYAQNVQFVIGVQPKFQSNSDMNTQNTQVKKYIFRYQYDFKTTNGSLNLVYTRFFQLTHRYWVFWRT